MPRDKFVKEIIQLMPAPGWRVVACWLHRDHTAYGDGDICFFNDFHVVGWGIVRHVPLNEDKSAQYDEIKLFVMDEGDAVELDNNNYYHGTTEVLGPGEELDDNLKEQIKQRLQHQIQLEEAQERAKIERIKRAHKAGTSIQLIAANERSSVELVRCIVASADADQTKSLVENAAA
jgi:hypothetical protein